MTWFTSTCGKIDNVLDFMTAKITKEIKEYYTNANGDSLAEVIASAAINYKSKFIIIIDEWDAIFREAKNNVEIQKAYVILLRSLFKSPVTNKMIALGYMTGILPI